MWGPQHAHLTLNPKDKGPEQGWQLTLPCRGHVHWTPRWQEHPGEPHREGGYSLICRPLLGS